MSCTHTKRIIAINVAVEFATALRDVRANMAELVSSTGFTDAATSTRKHINITLCSIFHAQNHNSALLIQVPVFLIFRIPLCKAVFKAIPATLSSMASVPAGA